MAPMQVKLRNAIGVLKDQTSISLAKVSSNGIPDMDVAIVKATSHDEVPMEEKYVQEVLHLSSYSRMHVSACVQGIARRLNKTRNWVVAIKALMLAHRLIRDGDPAFEQELRHSGRRGMRVLNVSDFRDESDSNGWDYSAFIHAYGLYLDERLDCVSVGSLASRPKSDRRGSYNGSKYEYSDSTYYHDGYLSRDHDESKRSSQESKPKVVKEMRPDEIMENFPHFQRLLERVLACRPTGAAKVNRIVNIALYPVVRESFMLYADIRDGLAILVDAFFDMEPRECNRAFDIYSRAAKQMDDLIAFYGFCKALGVCRTSEYPTVEKISDEMLETMEDFLRNRTESSRPRRTRSPERRSWSPRRDNDEESYEVNGVKALPAPPVVVEEPPPPPPMAQPAAAPSPPQTTNNTNADFININEPPISSEEHENRLALALFDGTTETKVSTKWESFSSSTEQGSSSSNGATSNGNGTTGWELALVETESNISKPRDNSLAGGFDRLLLDSLYDQGSVNQKMMSATAPTGSASSVAMPGRPQSNFLALPAPPAAATALSEDPFSASLNVPPPAYVQMTEMQKKQQLLVQEQQQWLAYQQGGMPGYGMMKYPNNPFAATFQPTAYPAGYYGYGYNPHYL